MPFSVVRYFGRCVFPGFAGKRRVDVQFVGIVEEGVEAVELLLGEGVALVIVALGALEGESEPDGPEGAGAILDLEHAEFLEVRAAFPVAERIAKKTGGDALLRGCSGQQISGKLLGGEPVKRQVAIEGLYHPLPPTPRHGAQLIGQVAVAVTVMRQVHPPARPFFTKMRAAQ